MRRILRRFDTPPIQMHQRGAICHQNTQASCPFPQQAGTLTIQPLQLELALLAEDPKGGDFYSIGRYNAWLFKRGNSIECECFAGR